MADYGGSTTPEDVRDLSQTPETVFTAVDAHFNFGCDVAASEANAKCRKFIDAEMDALSETTRWPRCWKWCNPPYSDIGPWVARAASEGKTVMLIPAYITTPSWGHLLADLADEIIMLKERISFIRQDTGKPMKSNPKGSMLVIFHDGSRAAQLEKTSIQSIDNLTIASLK